MAATPHPLRTISIGGATFDLFVEVDHSILQMKDGQEAFSLPLGKKVKVNEVISTCGGGACNTATGLSRLGCSAAFCGVVGDDKWGTLLLETLEKEGVDTKSATVIEEETSSFSIVLRAESGERVILYEPGATAYLHDVTFDREAVARADWVYLNHIHNDSSIIQDDLAEILTSPHHPHFTWNPGGCQIETGLSTDNAKALVAATDFLLLNKEEALAFTKTNTIEEALHLLSRAGARFVCITDGKRGVVATDGHQVFRCPTQKTVVVDTTGAGDAFGTGVTWALLLGKDLPTALRAGTINAMSVVGAVGAQAGLLTDTEIESKLANTDIAVDASPL